MPTTMQFDGRRGSAGRSLAPLACAALCAGAMACDGSGPAGPGDLDGGMPGPSTDAGTPEEFSEPGYRPPAQLAWRVVRGRDGQSVTQAEFLAVVARAPALCLGETHDDYLHHSMQLLVTNHVARAAGAAFGVGMEMFELPFQAPLDEFGAGTIDELTMLQRTQWAQRWGFEWPLYRPIVLFAVRRQHPVVALRAARELTSRVSQLGIAGLTEAERAQLPELDLTNAQHLAWFREQVQGAHDQLTEDRLARMYAVQVVWDESMADSAARWLKAAAGRRMALIAGNGHCVELGIPMRMRRRGITGVVAVQMVLDDPTEVGDAVAEGLADYVVAIGN